MATIRTMKKIGVIANPKRPHAADVFDRLVRKADALGWTLLADEQTGPLIPSAQRIEPHQFAEDLDLLLAMGGDGTVLFCAKRLNGADIPILGINLGSLGFLTGVSEDKMEEALEAIERGNCLAQARTVAQCTTPSGKQCRILNDAVIGFGNSSRIATLDLIINGELTTSYTCDGLIVCTPTGSTGHSLSAGGPILQPGCNAFGISVICPHTLSNRPLVIADSSTVEIRVRNAYKPLLLSVDGQDTDELFTGDTLCIARSDRPVQFLYPPDHSYFSVLRRKLHWRGSNF